MDKIFGYDLICYEDSIEFAMELCQQPNEVKEEEEENIRQELFENLKTMHSLKMVHRDIKEPNIGWSEEFGRWVFLDFGFSTMLRQSIGQKTYTKFIGTFKYTYDELQKLYYFERGDEVDFYYNDIYGLERSIKKIVQERVEKKEKEK